MSKRLSELPVASAVAGSEIIPIVQGGVTKRTTVTILTEAAVQAALATTGLATQAELDAGLATRATPADVSLAIAGLSGSFVGPAAPVVAATSATVVGSARVTGDTVDRFRVRADGTLDFGTPGNLSSRLKVYPTAAGMETDGSLTLRKEVTGGTVAPEMILRSKASDGTFPFWVGPAIDIANTIHGRDFVLAAKGDYPGSGNVSDFVMATHNGTGPPGFAVGGWPPDAAAMAHFQINAADLTKVTMRVGFVTSQTGDVLRVGGASADTFVVQADSSVRVKSSAAEAFSVRNVGNALLFLVDATGAGQVLSPSQLFGIGNAWAAGGTPGTNLDISVTTGNSASIRARSANGADFQVLVPPDLTGTRVGTTNATPLHFQTNNVTRMSFGTAGEWAAFGGTPASKWTSLPADATDLATAIALVNDLKNNVIKRHSIAA